MNKYTLLKDNNTNFLLRDKKPLVCPRVQPIPIPKDTLRGQIIEYQRTNCGDWCPLFEIKEFSELYNPEPDPEFQTKNSNKILEHQEVIIGCGFTTSYQIEE